ncbi:helix-turn-helix domain-containing protein [Bacillus infantis]|uniref:Helix-turn-helix domain-containing protein n=1 Tax=Bacillus infantis TaxID=324767 RepID=A0A5D4S6Q2_9BACI|nr:helix-turn-helix domain-containing protein [Bacillus infantis]TYS57898.1 helix-turn-helix domain-containing protein [Bacillus infantis]
MIEIKVDEGELKSLYLSEIQKRLDRIEFESMLMDSKQLCKMLSLSWPTVEKEFIRDPNFPKIRLGTKWLFNRSEVQQYINHWSIEIRKRGAKV